MDGIYTMASPSVSSLYGNVGCAIRELILSKFPYNFFKYTNVSTEVAFKNMRRQFGSNTNTEMTKRKRPYLIIQPQYQEPDPDGFLQNVPLTKNEMDTQYGVDARYLFDIIHDYNDMYDLKFKLNRDRLEYEVTISFTTQMQQLDTYKAMMNQVTWDRWTYYTTALESIIPKTMVRYMARLSGMDIDQNPELVPQFIRHLNDNSSYPITYKLRNASATDEYFMYYTHHLMVIFQDINIADGNMKGMINDDFRLTFKVITEFNLPGLYVLSGNTEKLRGLKASIGVSEIESDSSEYIPLFSVTNLFNRYPQKLDGMSLYSAYIFNTDAGTKNEDILDLKAVFNQEQIQAIKFQTDHGVMPETIARLIILKNGVESTDWEVNWPTLTLKIKDPDDTASYRLILYVNMSSINDILANSRMAGPYDQHALHDNTLDYPDNDDSDDTTSENDASDENSDQIESKEESQEKTIMKYSSSIFDDPNSVIAEAPVAKTKFTSSANPNRTNPKIIYRDNPNPGTLKSIDVWSKVISAAMLYNFANAIAIENDNQNYTVESVAEQPADDN